MVETFATLQTKTSSLSPDWFPGIAFVVDSFIVIASGTMAYASSDTWLASRLWVYLALSTTIALTVAGAVKLAGGYRLETIRSPIRRVARIVFPACAAFAIITAIAFFFLSPVYWNITWFFTIAAAVTVGIALGRGALLVLLFSGCRAGWVKRKVAILGVTNQGKRVQDQLLRDPFHMNEIVGRYDASDSMEPEHRNPSLVSGSLDDLIVKARAREIDDVIVALEWEDHAELSKVLDSISACPVRVHLGDSPAAPKLTNRESSEISQGIRTVTFSANHFTAWHRILKAIEDRVLAALLIVVLFPVFAVTAIAVKLESRGPVIYRQPRYGFNNQVFNVFKFRSMTHNEVRSDTEGRQQATKGDPRITAVGAFIRRTSIDELPQLFNVLGGSMSLVGPRPHSVEHNEEYGRLINRYFARHKVKPGITGLAQVNGLRGRTDTLEKMEYRVKYDLYYVENWSILMDLEILALTAVFGIVGNNAF